MWLTVAGAFLFVLLLFLIPTLLRLWLTRRHAQRDASASHSLVRRAMEHERTRLRGVRGWKHNHPCTEAFLTTCKYFSLSEPHDMPYHHGKSCELKKLHFLREDDRPDSGQADFCRGCTEYVLVTSHTSDQEQTDRRIRLK